MDALVSCLSSLYGAAWLGLLWAPFAAVAAGYGPAYSIFRQFTWWCWLLQALFYTAVHPWARKREILHVDVVRRSGDVLGFVCGNVAFTCIEFCVVLARHPTIVAETGHRLHHPAGVQLANVGLHYLTVSALLLWTLFDIDHVRHVLRVHVRTRAQRARFCAAWLALPLLYLASYEFDVAAVARTYGVPLDGWTAAGGALGAGLAAQFNLLYLAHLAAAG